MLVEKTLEATFDALCGSIDGGLGVSEMIYDDAGDIGDMVHPRTNCVFERHGGGHDLAGRSIHDVLPAVEDHRLKRHRTVARTGEPIREESYQQDVGRWFDGYSSRIDEKGHFVTTVFNDIAERKLVENAIRESEARHRLPVEA